MVNSWDPVIGTDEYNLTLRKAEKIAAEKGFQLNADGERVQKVIGLMAMNYTETGSCYCPCKQSHPLDTEKDVICPCPELQEEVETDGHCFCKLFYKWHQSYFRRHIPVV